VAFGRPPSRLFRSLSMTSAADAWQRFLQYLIRDEALGFSLDVSRMRFDGAFLDRMREPMIRALAAMTELEKGAIANPDEKRMVGHYWLRAPELAPTPELRGAIERNQRRIQQFVNGIHGAKIRGQADEPFTHVLVVGIGGSALGPQLLADALGNDGDLMRVAFLDNTDPDGIARVLQGLSSPLDRVLTLIVSKSGGTPETRNGMLETMAAYKRRDLDFARHAVAVTGEGSALDRLAESDGWLARFPMWDWVGGRTSVTAGVGLLPAALQGIDVEDLLAGARAMDERTRRADPLANPAAMLALMWHWAGDGRGARDMVILPYKDRLVLFSKYLQQLIMESLGKELDLQGRTVHQGIAVYGNKGSTDQHAYVQQLRDGIGNFFATFIGVLADDAGSDAEAAIEVETGITTGDFLEGFQLGTRQALAEKGRESITIVIDRLSPFSLGMLIALYERAVGLYASLIGVNAYHQPGVEAGKQAAAAVLQLQTRLQEAMNRHSGSARTAEEWAGAIGATDQVETIYRLLERMAGNIERGIRRAAADSPGRTTYAYNATVS
jgi:glucose-6-phosphate isomerase